MGKNMTLLEKIIARAKANKQRIVLPESLEERTLTAADKALADDLAEIILIGSREEIFNLANKLGLKNIVELRNGKDKLLQAEQSELESKYMTILNIDMLKFYQNGTLK